MVQDAIEAAWAKRASLRDTNKFAGWIVRILTNCCKNTLRRRKVLSFFPLEKSNTIIPEPAVKSPVEEALEQLSPESRLVMNPTSVHQEEAAKFMAFHLKNLDPLTAYLLDASRTEPLRPQNYETARKDLTGQIDTLNSQITLSDDAEAKKAEELQALQQRLARLESSWRFSQEDIEIYQTIAAKVVVSTRTIYPMDSDVFSAIFDELTEQLAASSMSVDLFIRLLNEKTRIIFAEMQ